MPIDQTRLNECITKAAEFLARVLSPRVETMRLVKQDGYCQIYLENLFQADQPVTISTQNNEVTVEFGESHTHYDAYDESITEDRLAGQMVEKVVRIVGEVDRSFSAWSGASCLGFGWLQEQDGVRWMIKTFPLANRFNVIGWVLEDNLDVLRDPSLGLGAPPLGAAR